MKGQPRALSGNPFGIQNFAFDPVVASFNLGRMKHSGKARKAGFKLIVLTFVVGFMVWALMAVGSLITAILSAIAVPALLIIWLLFSIFTLYFFRDPTPHVPAGSTLVVSPAHGKVDVIDTVNEPLFMGGDCQRVSIFLSVFNVHVQNAPVSGRISFFNTAWGNFSTRSKPNRRSIMKTCCWDSRPATRPDRELGCA